MMKRLRSGPCGPAALAAGILLIACTAAFGQVKTSNRPDDAETETRPARKLAPAARPAYLDGREKSFVIVGYSTSYAWPEMLQSMLDEHARGAAGGGDGGEGDGDRVYHVLNAVIGGSPVERWIGEPGSRDYDPTVGAMLRDFFGPEPRLRGDAPEPTVALCQQSLQFTRTRRGPIASLDDKAGLRIGTDALEKLALRLHDHGITHVVIGMHIYKQPVEPEVGNERFALESLLGRGYPFIFEGPDVWSATLARFPEAFDEDGIHPNELGMKIMAEGWYRVLAGGDARQDVIDRMNAKAWDVRAMMDAYRKWRREG